MFTQLRKKSGSIIIYLMFAAIIVTFVVSFGPGDQGCQSQPNWVASVNGDILTQSEFRFTFNNYYDFYQRMIPDFNAQKAREMGLSKTALDMLTDNLLLAQEAERQGFISPESEVRDQILTTPYFQQNGVFDRDQYARFVQFQMGMSVTAYEEKVRKDLLAEKLREFLSLSADISETEVKDEFIARNESVDARFLVFSAATFTDAARERVKEAVTDDDAAAFAAREAEKIKKFYDDNAARWKKEDDTTRPLDEVKTAIARELLVADRIAALVNAEAGKALSLLSSASYKPELLKKDIPDWAVEFQEQTDLRKSAKYLRDIGIAPELIGNLFTHQPVPGYLPQVYTVDDKRVIAFVGKHTPADMVRFETEKEQLRRELHSAKTRTITDAYAKKLREKAKIEINRNWLAAFGETGDQ